MILIWYTLCQLRGKKNSWDSFMLSHIIRRFRYTSKSKDDNIYLHFYPLTEWYWFTKGLHNCQSKNCRTIRAGSECRARLLYHDLLNGLCHLKKKNNKTQNNKKPTLISRSMQIWFDIVYTVQNSAEIYLSSTVTLRYTILRYCISYGVMSMLKKNQPQTQQILDKTFRYCNKCTTG